MRLIDADALMGPLKLQMESYRRIGETERAEAYANCLWEIAEAPAIDAALVVHAKWIGRDLGTCSACGHNGCAPDIWDGVDGDGYCPNCGAKMDGGNNNGKTD